MPPILIAMLTIAATAPAGQAPPAAPDQVAPVEVTAPRPAAARSHARVVADRWSPRIVTCRGVFVQGIGVVRRVCATNQQWEIEAQRIRHEFMQAQWRSMQ